MRFHDRREAGTQLGSVLARLALPHPTVIGLARGGMPVAAKVARALHAPLDVLVVRKLGHPDQPELGLGAIAEGGVAVYNDELIVATNVRADDLEHVERVERRELDRRIAQYRGNRPAVDLAGRTAILVDDGIATGSTARAAIASLRQRGATSIVVAVPVASPDAYDALRTLVDRMVCLHATADFGAVGEYYDDFSQVSDTDIEQLLAASHTDANPGQSSVDHDERSIAIDGRHLPALLDRPVNARGLVVFAHGSGSTRLSRRNTAVAQVLQDAGLATLRFDLLAPDEAHHRANVFDIAVLADRLVAATAWVRGLATMSGLPIGYFGASTGAAAALVAAARLRGEIAAVVSRGGRPDLAAHHLAQVTAPTLLIVGARDDDVVDLNILAQRHLRCVNKLVVVPNATHLFEEPGTLEEVATLARDWFLRHLPQTRPG
ncbi:MAG: alpha/beta family hydrolase [Nitriliruptoraceae bacterium]